VLGAGNVSSIAPADAIEQLFVHDRVVLLKLSPVLTYLEPILRRALAPLVEHGVLELTTGDARVGRRLVDHPLVRHVHVTGRGATLQNIVFGGDTVDGHRAASVLGKSVSAELGDVSPVIVVPGPWSRSDLRFHALQLATAMTHTAGFTCSAPRLLVQHAEWPQRNALLDELGTILRGTPLRYAFYPGAKDRWRRFLDAHPDAERHGLAAEDELPWTLIRGLDPDTDDICFEEEPFCCVLSETGLAARDTAAFVDRAVEFVNERLWGSLSATLLVHPSTLADPTTAAAVERAVGDLRYGQVAVNQWAGVGFSYGTAPWGGYPGATPERPASGIGFVHNPYRLPSIEKTVVRAGFRAFQMRSWSLRNDSYEAMCRGLTRLAAGADARGLIQTAVAAAGGWRGGRRQPGGALDVVESRPRAARSSVS
jgi:acyl-CoA reductase-like NAD-dependent aldehyde dehydrogenase